MSRIDEINNEILELKKEMSIKNISDGYHTFGDLYKHRTILFSALCNAMPEISWKSKKHYDEENDPMFEGNFIAGINTKEGVASYHIKLEYWDLFCVPELERAPKFDLYTNEDVLERLKSLSKPEKEKETKKDENNLNPIRMIRIAKDLKTEDMAFCFSVTSAYISAIEKGERKFKEQTLKFGLDNLGITLEDYYDLESFKEELLNTELSKEEKHKFMLVKTLGIVNSKLKEASDETLKTYYYKKHK